MLPIDFLEFPLGRPLLKVDFELLYCRLARVLSCLP